MKRVLFILPTLILFLAALPSNATSIKGCQPNTSSFSIFEPGETVFVELPGFDVSKMTDIKNYLTSTDIGAQWLGYCEDLKVICVKVPAGGQLVLEDALKQSTGGYHLKATSSVAYSISDSCFVVE